MEVYGADLDGIEGQLIRFRATVDVNRRGAALLGLARKVVREGYARAVKAIETLDGGWSDVLADQGYTIDLEPAETPKTSSGLDLPIAIMLLQASILQNLEGLQDQIRQLGEKQRQDAGKRPSSTVKKRILEQIEELVRQRERILRYRKALQRNTRKYLLIGKLDIADGSISPPYHGMFCMIAAARPGFTVVVPEEAEVYASIVATHNRNITTLKAANLQEVWDVILGAAHPRRTRKSVARAKRKVMTRHVPDLRDIRGVARAKRAMTVALAGGHNILLVGPNGQGKSMLALAATRLLPDLGRDEMFDLNKIYSAKGDLQDNEVVLSRPFRSIQNITAPALFGGGVHPPVPGEVSLAHEGVLLLDEINQLKPPSLIERLRSTLNDRVQRVQRVYQTLTFPCNFVLVAAMNPCRCSWYGHYICPVCEERFFGSDAKCPSHHDARLQRKCTCTRREIEAFRSTLSEPLLDRIDLKVFVSSFDRSQGDPIKYASATIRQHIKAARQIQQERYAKAPFGTCNASVPDRTQFRKYTPPLLPRVSSVLEKLFKRIDSLRTQDKVLLVARTVADLDSSRTIRLKDIKEAVDLMGIDHEYFRGLPE